LRFILQSERKPKPESLRPYYRCEETFDRLNVWLRRKGIRANKPLHELRKEVGAIIATEQGIYAASKFLRHSDITTTARHYADQKARINVGLGKFLDTTIKPAKEPRQAIAA
jgi:integrase